MRLNRNSVLRKSLNSKIFRNLFSLFCKSVKSLFLFIVLSKMKISGIKMAKTIFRVFTRKSPTILNIS